MTNASPYYWNMQSSVLKSVELNMHKNIYLFIFALKCISSSHNYFVCKSTYISHILTLTSHFMQFSHFLYPRRALV